MKKILSAVLSVFLVLGAAQAAQAQLVFLAGMGVGAAMTSGDDNCRSYSEQNYVRVMYQLPKLAERVKDPLSVAFVVIKDDLAFNGGGGGQLENISMRDVFASAVRPRGPAEKFEILEVAMYINRDDPRQATIWFAYCPKEQVASNELFSVTIPVPGKSQTTAKK